MTGNNTDRAGLGPGRARGQRFAIGLAGAAFAVMAFAVLKNIGYPLLWNDEGETAMFAERVLDFGYPKVSDGKNVVYCLELEDKMAGRRSAGGAYLGSGWGHFYFGAIGALAARGADAIAGVGARTAVSGETEDIANAKEMEAGKGAATTPLRGAPYTGTRATGTKETSPASGQASGQSSGFASDPSLGTETAAAQGSRSDRPRRADVYLKTALLRIPFALAGLAAIILAVIAVAPLLARFPSTRVWWFAAALFAWQAISVPWALHMREMRYYPLVCLLLAWMLYLGVRRHIGRMGAGRYGILMFAALVLLLVTFPVAVAAAGGILGLWEVVRFARRKSWREARQGLAPLAAAGAAMGAYVVVFRTFEISRGFNEMFPWSMAVAKHTADRMLALFFDYESLWVILAALGLGVGVAVVSWARERRSRRRSLITRAEKAGEKRVENPPEEGASALPLEAPHGTHHDGPAGEPHGEFPGGLHGTPSTELPGNPLMMGRADRRLVGLAAVIAVYSILHAAVVMRQPFPIAFSRYYIWLQPAAGLAMWLCLFALGGTVRALRGKWVRRAARVGLAGGFLLLGALTAGERVPVLRERVYELFHKNVGPMDYAVAFVQRSYPDPSRLVIATNYEECVLQYYLGSKVTVGFVGNNLKEDMKIVPDIIIGRKRWAYTNEPMLRLMERAEYRIKTFWIVDTATNTVPEVGGREIVHRFRTPRTGSDRQALHIRVRKGREGSGLKIQD